MDLRSLSLKLRSHNIHGFNSSKDFLYQSCNNDDFSILAIQEHWLRPACRKVKGTNQLKVLHPDFDAFGCSAMDSQVESSIMKGRPFGGTGFIFNKMLSNSLRARVDLKHPRVSVMELSVTNHNLLLINAYMPFYNTSSLPDQLTDYRNTVAFIENIMTSNPSHKFILFMDMNCNLFRTSHPFSELINGMSDFDFDLVSNSISVLTLVGSLSPKLVYLSRHWAYPNP